MLDLFKIRNLRLLGEGWPLVYQSALGTIGKNSRKIPSVMWKKQILRAEHSPIRCLNYTWTWANIPYWVSTHFVRHKIGIEHFVSTQRSDKTGIDRNQLRQDALVNHTITANAQAIINISRKRLCRKSSAETRYVWDNTISLLFLFDREMASACAAECIYRGFCPERQTCGFYNSDEYHLKRHIYLN